jgi:uncharacterized protein YozE (UPF0346 family)
MLYQNYVIPSVEHAQTKQITVLHVQVQTDKFPKDANQNKDISKYIKKEWDFNYKYVYPLVCSVQTQRHAHSVRMESLVHNVIRNVMINVVLANYQVLIV